MWTSSLLSALQLAKYKEGLLGKARWEGRLKVENKNEVKKELTSEVRICVVDSRKIERQGVEVYGAGKLVDVYLRENPKRMAAKSKEQLEAENAAANWQQEVS